MAKRFEKTLPLEVQNNIVQHASDKYEPHPSAKIIETSDLPICQQDIAIGWGTLQPVLGLHITILHVCKQVKTT